MRVLEIRVLPDDRRILLRVQMPDPDRYLTSQVPHLPKLLFQLIPRLSKHTCENGCGLSFRQECQNTEIPHLFEHLIIELQLQAQRRPTDLLRGETEWNWTVDPRGHFQVTVEYDNELLAVAAIRLAARILHTLDSHSVDIDIDTEVERLRAIMALGEELQGKVPAPPPSRARGFAQPQPTSRASPHGRGGARGGIGVVKKAFAISSRVTEVTRELIVLFVFRCTFG